MSKYIDLELALNELLRLYEEDVDAYGVEIPETFDYKRAKEALSDLPTTDIVHCEDCKHNPKRTNNLAYGRCVCCCEDDWYAYVPDDDFFCRHGERIEK